MTTFLAYFALVLLIGIELGIVIDRKLIHQRNRHRFTSLGRQTFLHKL